MITFNKEIQAKRFNTVNEDEINEWLSQKEVYCNNAGKRFEIIAVTQSESENDFNYIIMYSMDDISNV